MTKTCKTCGRVLDVELFYRHYTNLDGRSGSCIKCTKVRMARWRDKNRPLIAKLAKNNNAKPKHRQQCREWQRLNSDRARLHNRRSRAKHPETMRRFKHARAARLMSADVGDVTSEFLRGLYKTWSGTCPLCNRERCKPSIDHKVPLSRGGLHCQDNLWLICVNCNSRKRALTVDEFFNLLRSRG